MQVTRNDTFASEIIRNASNERARLRPRAPGIHVSDLIYCRRKSWYRLNGYAEPAHDDDTLTLFMTGHLVHEFLQQGRPEVEITLPSGICVTGNIDAIDFYPCEQLFGERCDHIPACNYAPVEIKSTRYSSNKPVEEMQQYIDQLAAYCIGINSRHARLLILHIMGDYKTKRTGQLLAWDIEFTQNELDAWKMELDRRAEQLIDDTPPPLPCHRTWECRHCPFNSKFGGPCESGPGMDAQPYELKWERVDAVPAV